MRFIGLLLLFVYSHGTSAIVKPVTPGVSTDYYFHENKGQWHSHILAKALVPGGELLFSKQGHYYHFRDTPHLHHARDSVREHILTVRCVGADTSQLPLLSEATGFYSNFFLGADSTQWKSRVLEYRRFTYPQRYRGVDMLWYTAASNLKYEFHVAPHGAWQDIKLVYAGADSLWLHQGALKVRTSLTHITEMQPYAYQWVGTTKRQVPCYYELRGDTLSFRLGSTYDPTQALVIDPTIVFSSYTGSTADNFGYTATFDTAGNVYVGGVVYNFGDNILAPVNGFPANAGAFMTAFQGGDTDVVIFSFTPDGTGRNYATYLGGIGSETPQSLVVNSKMEVCVFGVTGSINFPTTSSVYDRTFNGGSDHQSYTNEIQYNMGIDAFVSKLSPGGSTLVASTFFGGNGQDGIDITLYTNSGTNYTNLGDEYRGEIGVDAQDNIFITAPTSSSNFPLKGPLLNGSLQGTQDGFLAKFSPDLRDLKFSVLFGGTQAEVASTLDINRAGQVYVCGATLSPTFAAPAFGLKSVSGGALEGYVLALDSTGKALYGTFLGTDKDDKAVFVRVDNNNNVNVFGQTWGNYPITFTGNLSEIYSNAHSGQFIHRLSGDLTKTVFSTVFGSGKGGASNVVPDMAPAAFNINDCGILMLTGWLGDLQGVVGTFVGSNMPTTPDALQPTNPQGTGFYLAAFTINMRSLDYATYLSGGAMDHVDGGTSRFDVRNGIVYQAVCAGCRKSFGYPQTPTYSQGVVSNNVWSPTNNSFNCNMMGIKYDFGYVPLEARIRSSVPPVAGTITGIAPFNLTFTNASNKLLGRVDAIWLERKPLFSNEDFRPTPNTQKYIPTYDEMDVYAVRLIGVDSTCNSKDADILFRDTALVVVRVLPTITGNNICEGTEATIRVIGGSENNQWPTTTLLLVDSTKSSATLTSNTSAVFTVTAVNRRGDLLYPLTFQINEVVLRPRAGFALENGAQAGIIPFEARFLNNSTVTGNAPLYQWYFGDGNSSNAMMPSYTYNREGLYRVKLVLTDRVNDCQVKDSITKTLKARLTTTGVAFCIGSFDTLAVIKGGTSFRWVNSRNVRLSTDTTLSWLATSVPGTYKVYVRGLYGYQDTLLAVASQYPKTEFEPLIKPIDNLPDRADLQLLAPTLILPKVWHFPNDKKVLDQSLVEWSTDTEGDFVFTLTGIDEYDCTVSGVFTQPIRFVDIPNVFTPNADGINDAFELTHLLPGTASLEVYNRWGVQVYKSAPYGYYQDFDARQLPDGVYYYLITFRSKPERPIKGWVQVLR